MKSELETIVHLSEECGEVCQIIGKIIRFGYDSHHPDDPDKTMNVVLLEREMNDVKKRIEEVEKLCQNWKNYESTRVWLSKEI